MFIRDNENLTEFLASSLLIPIAVRTRLGSDSWLLQAEPADAQIPLASSNNSSVSPFTITEVNSEGWGKLKSGAGWIYLKNASYCTIGKSVASSPAATFFTAYKVRVVADTLNIRKGAGTNYGKNGAIKDHGVYTIVAESDGKGTTKWGKLKSGAGWISLDYCKKV